MQKGGATGSSPTRRSRDHLSETGMRLEQELAQLKALLNAGCTLIVQWLPRDESKLSGEVRGGVIYIYERDEDRAIATLKHEFLDHHITHEVVRPLVDYINVQKGLIEGLIYQRKEEVVDRLSRLL
jgi:hypothetical protein